MNRQFEKFDELLVYIAERSADDPTLGDLKLNKLLYYADVTAYRRRGATISDTRYQHLEHGPASVSLLPARKNLVAAGVLDVKPRHRYSFWQKVTRALRPARRDVFDPDELAIVDEILERFRDRNGSEMAELSHGEPGWQMTEMGEDIPIETALLTPTVSPESVTVGRDLAKRYGW